MTLKVIRLSSGIFRSVFDKISTDIAFSRGPSALAELSVHAVVVAAAAPPIATVIRIVITIHRHH